MPAILLFGAVSTAITVPDYFPGSFVGTWGIEGARCGTEGTPRVKIKARELEYDGQRQPVVRTVSVESNVVEVALQSDRTHPPYLERLTVGTTGSRLFRERDDKVIAVYYRCE
ncbi:hypothetical protein SCH01S_23_00410 [Sphingomonas changbaiensis NBRC 104936]|uniref:Uncharacterized protein n=1 Tax=Sphingomonas changbaiensis NBRC 104936 TaxID=1219043 RepID=A0A0E9MNC3_9SPHN|nr:hypothetical protein [Sphingomonas changbaiensis]GAO38998.1 hypothetical protein SCH01S_23_00410 [Sphingomonas changbaiensis NBRC 104936]